jgi:transposase-like protein
MPQAVFSDQQLIVLDALAVGASLTQAAAEAGVHRNTIANWRRETLNFQMALTNAQYDRALAFREHAEELTTKAFATLDEILSDPKASPSVRLKAALAIVNLVTTQMPPQKRVPLSIADVVMAPMPTNRPEPPPPPIPETTHNLHNEPQPTIRREQPKVGRNEPCPCGSGLKHKRCCLDKPAPATTTAASANA